MQTNSIQINSWDALYTMFTTLEPEDRRMAVLRAIADPKTEIGHNWTNCLFAVAARAADRSVKSISSKVAAQTLGIPISQVRDGVKVWDVWDQRGSAEAFRSRIREHLAELENAERAADQVMEQARQANSFVKRVKETLGITTTSPPLTKERKTRELTHV